MRLITVLTNLHTKKRAFYVNGRLKRTKKMVKGEDWDTILEHMEIAASGKVGIGFWDDGEFPKSLPRRGYSRATGREVMAEFEKHLAHVFAVCKIKKIDKRKGGRNAKHRRKDDSD